MTYTVRDCISYSDTTSVVMQEFDSDGRLHIDAPLCGFQGQDRLRKAVKKALMVLWWDERRGFTGGEVYVQGKGNHK